MSNLLKETVHKYGVAILVVCALLLGWHLYQSYQHFSWQLVRDPQKGTVYAVPTWRKD